MSTFFNTVHITNFKSLKDVTLSDCKRINLLIGKPNVGKSNILEAIGVFNLLDADFNKKTHDFVRLKFLPELFFDGNINETISIKSDNIECRIHYRNKNARYENQVFFSFFRDNIVSNIITGENLNIAKDESINLSSNVKFYKFSTKIDSNNKEFSCLASPFGENLFNIIQTNSILKKEIASIFSDYNLKLVFDKVSQSLKVMKETKGDDVFLLPYDSIADTLQRVIFFKTAIASNTNSILLFEEPEAHCFPPYIRHITQEIIESESNQFFIATHSPYVLNDFLEYERDDVAIFIAHFKDGQTVIRRLTDDEINDVYQYGIDLFFNHELFTDD
jgi:AAA15 family ATPase/GTPase